MSFTTTQAPSTHAAPVQPQTFAREADRARLTPAGLAGLK
jgi:hypothetical protein